MPLCYSCFTSPRVSLKEVGTGGIMIKECGVRLCASLLNKKHF